MKKMEEMRKIQAKIPLSPMVLTKFSIFFLQIHTLLLFIFGQFPESCVIVSDSVVQFNTCFEGQDLLTSSFLCS